MITATVQGRDLHLTVGGVEPFVVQPLPGRVGAQITDTYVQGAMERADAQEMTDALILAIDGAPMVDGRPVKGPSGVFEPRPEGDRPNWDRIQDQLSQTEAETVLLCAFFWQTILGIEGVNAFLEAGGGFAGGVKALTALAARTGLLPLRTSPSSELDDLIRSRASTPSTSSLPAGRKPGKPLLDRLPKRKKRG